MSRPKEYVSPDPRPPLTEKERSTIAKAKRLLMKRYDWTEDKAFHSLRNKAMNTRLRMADLAQLVLDGSISFDNGVL